MIKKFISILLILLLSTPVYAQNAATPKSQLEIREIQTHYFETPNVTLVFKAAINALQDNGFVILNVEPDLGYITARKDFKSHRINKARIAGYSTLIAAYGALAAFSLGSTLPSMIEPSMMLSNELHDKTVVVDANVNIEKVGTQSKMRFVMVEKVLENADGYSYVKSAPRQVTRISDPALYQEFFTQVDKSIFYEKI